MPAESQHVAGEEGVVAAKQFLEATTFVNVTFTVYDDIAQTTLRGLGETRKAFDLTGFFLGENRRPLYAEVKNYNSAGGQAQCRLDRKRRNLPSYWVRSICGF